MSQKLGGSVCLITGASAGIGRACALALVREGASLVLIARRKSRLDELVETVHSAGGRAVAVVGDVREEETALRAMQTAKEQFGALHILLNNAGVGNYKPLIETSADEYDELMETNMRSTFLFTRHAVPLILMLSSMAGKYGFAGEAVYCASKFALGKGRTAEGVAQSGMLDPEDVAEAVLLACTQPAHARIIEIQMRPMVEPLA
jgi:NADP-dependent 3-hydroxy acid dehydrogenase YdfG